MSQPSIHDAEVFTNSHFSLSGKSIINVLFVLGILFSNFLEIMFVNPWSNPPICYTNSPNKFKNFKVLCFLNNNGPISSKTFKHERALLGGLSQKKRELKYLRISVGQREKVHLVVNQQELRFEIEPELGNFMKETFHVYFT